jgi:flavin reductase (DIM6/NTAB) family NADH-FMN oxidoreductase RutF
MSCKGGAEFVHSDSANDPLETDGVLAGPGVDARTARWIRRHMAGGVTVITTVHRELYRGTTVSACITASIDPFQLLISIEEDSQMEEWIQSSGVFAANLLPWSEQFLADQFAGYTPLASGKFERIPHSIGSTGAPILDGSIAWVDCRVEATFRTGDHVCFVGKAMWAGSGKGPADDPLVYFFNRYRRLS